MCIASRSRVSHERRAYLADKTKESNLARCRGQVKGLTGKGYEVERLWVQQGHEVEIKVVVIALLGKLGADFVGIDVPNDDVFFDLCLGSIVENKGEPDSVAGLDVLGQ